MMRGRQPTLPHIFRHYGMWCCDSGHFNPTLHEDLFTAYLAWKDKLRDCCPDVYRMYMLRQMSWSIV